MREGLCSRLRDLCSGEREFSPSSIISLSSPHDGDHHNYDGHHHTFDDGGDGDHDCHFHDDLMILSEEEGKERNYAYVQMWR